jgi:hypothetical protein
MTLNGYVSDVTAIPVADPCNGERAFTVGYHVTAVRRAV